jgi:hypothetical protein
MKRRALYFIMVLVLVLGVGLTLPMPVGAAKVTFTGNVTVDFTGPGVLTIPDPGGVGDVGLGAGAPPGTVSGWDMADLRLAYNATTDTLYVGINTPRIAGDADGDGNPGVTSAWLLANGGNDTPNLSGTETIAVYFDLNKDGTYDVIAGVPGTDDINGFTCANFTYLMPGNVFNPPYNFGANLTGHIGTYYANPSAVAPNFEFTILNFSTLPGSDSSIGGFIVGAFLGSIQDNGVGEDYIDYEQNPHTVVTIVSSAPKVISGGSVTLNVTEANTGNVSLTSPQVAVTKNGGALTTLLAPPASGDDGNGVLDVGETWHWNNISSGALTGTTQFVARGSGTAPGDFPVNNVTDLLEQTDVTVNTIAPNTTTTITVNATKVKPGGLVSLNVTEQNNGTDNLTAPRVEVRQNGILIATLNRTSSQYYSGDTADTGVLNVGETWKWTSVLSNAINAATTFEALGFGTDSLGDEISYSAGYTSERATVGVGTVVSNTTTTITVSATKVKLGGSVTLNVTEQNTGSDNLTLPYVEVRKNGVLIPASPLVAPPSSGDTNGNGNLDTGETWHWNNVSGGAITVATTFEAKGFGTDSLGQEVSYPTYPSERATVGVDTIETITHIIASATAVAPGDSVTLNVTEQNTGSENLTAPRVEVRQNGTLIATLNSTSPNFSGDNGNGILNAGETWKWTNVPSNAINAATTFEALGFGTDSLGHEVSYAAGYTSERDTVTVNVRGEGCLQICKFEDANVNGIWDAGEPGLPNWRFEVTGPDGYDEWWTTESDGCVMLSGLASGMYTVTEELKAGWYNTRPGGNPPYQQTANVQAGTECARVEFGNREEIKDIPPMIPTMNKWGIIAMIILFTGLVIWTVRRKRLAS